MEQTLLSVEQATKNLIDSLKQACTAHGLGNSGNEYKIIVQMFLYKFFNDKFGHEAKKTALFGKRLRDAEKWDAEYDTFTPEEVEDLFDYLPSDTPRLRPEHTIAHLYNAQQQGDFATLLDSTLDDIAILNDKIFSVATGTSTKSEDAEARVAVFDKDLLKNSIADAAKRSGFAIALCRHIADPAANFEPMFSGKYDFFSTIFEYISRDYNRDGGSVYAEYYTPRSIAQIIARLLVGRDETLRGVSCYDPSGGSGTLVIALAHQIGEERCTVYSQDISQKSTQMLRLNLILNNMVGSLKNVIEGDTLRRQGHLDKDKTPRRFDYITSNPPFNLDFSDMRETLATDTTRFWAGVPAVPNKDRKKMKIYLCFVQHVLNAMNEKGKGAIIVPTGFITAKASIEQKILQQVVDQHIVYGCVSMPSNLFATTGTNVSVIFFDNSRETEKVVLIDASKLGEKRKEGKNQRTFLRDFEIDQIVDTFVEKKAEDGFSVVVSHDEIAAKGYSLSAGQYFDVKIEHVDITADEFRARMAAFTKDLESINAESAALDREIAAALKKLEFAE